MHRDCRSTCTATNFMSKLSCAATDEEFSVVQAQNDGEPKVLENTLKKRPKA